MKVGIINVTGYSGIELARILSRHPEAEITCVTGRSTVGQRLGDVFPHLSALDLTITEDITDSVDVVFSALPHQASAERLAPFVESGVRAIDISADYRLKDLRQYEEWYGEHPHPSHVEDAVYGLPELHRDEVAGARLVANPGCYPTPSILALAPLAAAGLIESDIIVDAKSGVSGAGRSLDVKFLFTEVNESVRAYQVGGHRHMPEIAQELGRLNSNGTGPLSVTFLPSPHPDDERHSCQLLRQAQGRGVFLRRNRTAASHGPVPRLLRRAPLRPRDGRPALHQADFGEQRLPHLSDRRPHDGTPRGGRLHRQPRQGRGGAGGAEHEHYVRDAGGTWS